MIPCSLFFGTELTAFFIYLGGSSHCSTGDRFLSLFTFVLKNGAIRGDMPSYKYSFLGTGIPLFRTLPGSRSGDFWLWGWFLQFFQLIPLDLIEKIVIRLAWPTFQEYLCHLLRPFLEHELESLGISFKPAFSGVWARS